MGSLFADLRLAARLLLKSPGFTVVALAAIALGIGANTAIFTVVNAVLLHPLPYPDSGRIVTLLRTGGGSISVPEFNYFSQQNPGLEQLTAFDMTSAGVNLAGSARPEFVHGIHVSAAYFRLFGAHPILGRVFTAEEDRPGAPRVLVMSYGLWQRRFGGDAAILGKTVTLGGAPSTVAGVLSPGFQPNPATDLWLPLQADPNDADQAHYLVVAGRLAPGDALATAAARVTVVAKRYVKTHPDQIGDDDKIAVQPMRRYLTGDVEPALLILLGAVGLVLLIACANVANLLLAKAAGRQREMAIRSAIGAGCGRIVRQLLTESLLLAVAGGALGFALGSWGLRALLLFTPGDLPRAEELAATHALDPSMLAFAAAVSLLTGVLFGLFPAFQISRIDLSSALKESSGRSGTGLKHNRLRGILAASEMGLAVVLLCGAARLIRSFVALHDVDPGFDPHNLLTLQVSLAGERYSTTAASSLMTRQLAERIEGLPGVAAASAVNGLPLQGVMDMIFNIPGRPLAAGEKFTGDVQWRFVSGHYFEALRIPLRAGRFLRQREPSAVVVINEAMARKFWPKENPVGKTILIGAGLADMEQPPAEIAGIVGDVRENGLDNEAPPTMYQIYAQVPDKAMALVNTMVPVGFLIRSRPGVSPLSLRSEVEREFANSGTQLAPTNVRTMESVAWNSTARQNFMLMLLGVLAAIALLLAALGIYGVLAYTVEQRTQEIGIRAALGATRADTLRLIVGQGLRVSAIGMGAGLVAALGLTRLLASLLYGVKPADPLSFAAVAITLSLVSLAACAIPAYRATRVDPIVALRYE